MDIIPVFCKSRPGRVSACFQFILLGLEIEGYLHTKPNEREVQLLKNTHRKSPVFECFFFCYTPVVKNAQYFWCSYVTKVAHGKIRGPHKTLLRITAEALL